MPSLNLNSLKIYLLCASGLEVKLSLVPEYVASMFAIHYVGIQCNNAYLYKELKVMIQSYPLGCHGPFVKYTNFLTLTITRDKGFIGTCDANLHVMYVYQKGLSVVTGGEIF